MTILFSNKMIFFDTQLMKQEKERIKNYLIIELEIEFKINFDIIIKE